MSSNIVLTVEVRENTGKGGARAARREDLVPGVVYGGKEGAVAVTLRGNEVRKALNTGNFIANLLELDHQGKRQTVITKDVQFHPVTDAAQHVDLFRVTEKTRIDVAVPVRFTNEEASPGMKRGGVLNIVRHEVELNCPAGAIPSEVEADLTGLDIGDSIHISAITLPKGAKSTITDRDFTVATMQGSRAVLVDDEVEETDAEAVEGEGETAEGGED
ncbi:MAG: 50S ribosomal protein L25/general stress protein Ctc [Maricaulis sp.]|jgi:large subunit ribosomal protein L25|nr:50S ribosomal protein L25/general stress protein Ctc [Maricaulis sp.]MDG2044258.1 50S ribosomal protein L25/general stress protein Ctc [Maricaulis sp.]